MNYDGITATALELPPGFTPFFDIEGVHDDYEGLRVIVRGINNGHVWRIAFPGWDAYRALQNESDALVFGALCGTTHTGAMRIHGSSWAKEFAAEGTGWANSVEFLHIALAGGNSVVEVLLRDPPVFTQLTGREANV